MSFLIGKFVFMSSIRIVIGDMVPSYPEGVHPIWHLLLRFSGKSHRQENGEYDQGSHGAANQGPGNIYIYIYIYINKLKRRKDELFHCIFALRSVSPEGSSGTVVQIYNEIIHLFFVLICLYSLYFTVLSTFVDEE